VRDDEAAEVDDRCVHDAVAEEDAFTTAKARGSGVRGLVAHAVFSRIGVVDVDPAHLQALTVLDAARGVEALGAGNTQSLQLARGVRRA